MIRIKDLRQSDIGKWVKYNNGYGGDEVGRIKSWNEHNIFVVYKCNNEWDRFQDFTGQATKEGDLVFTCRTCNDKGYIEEMGDGENFEWDVIGTKPCPDCNNN